MSVDSIDLDLSTLSYEEWIAFFFDRRVLARDESFGDVFLKHTYIVESADPEKVISHLTRVFEEFPALAKRFSHLELNQGIWAMLGPTCDLSDVVTKPGVPSKLSLGCIRAMEIPFRDYVAKLEVPEMETGFFMWWDFVCKSFWRGRKPLTPKSMSADDRALLETLFQVLNRILALPDERARSCAIHGLGHLGHPRVRETVQVYMDRRRRKREVDPEEWRWLEQCRDGTVM